MKRSLAVVLFFIAPMSLTACGGAPTPHGLPSQPTTPSTAAAHPPSSPSMPTTPSLPHP